MALRKALYAVLAVAGLVGAFFIGVFAADTIPHRNMLQRRHEEVLWLQGELDDTKSDLAKMTKVAEDAGVEIAGLRRDLKVEAAVTEYVSAVNTNLEKAIKDPKSVLGPSGIPLKVLAEIQGQAEKDWPGNYSMQRSIIEAQEMAYVQIETYTEPSIPEKILARLKRKARSAWRRDYTMQLSTLETEIDSYLALQERRTSSR